MASNNDAVFEFAAQFVSQEVIDQAGEDVNQIRRRLVEKVHDYADSFYREMLFNGRYSGDKGFPEKSQSWEVLSPETVYRKGHDQFLDDSGDLLDNLLDSSPIADLGKPKVGFTPGQKQSGAAIFIDRAGRPQYAAGSGKRGFAPLSALRGLSFTLFVNVFKDLQGKTTRQMIDLMTSGEDSIKLGVFEHGRKHQTARPFVREFAEWYTTTGLQLFIDSQVRGAVKGRGKI